jgi:hypothetical protein
MDEDGRHRGARAGQYSGLRPAQQFVAAEGDDVGAGRDARTRGDFAPAIEERAAAEIVD